ncbi:MAG: phosphatidylinositol-specific phospholipase C domain-containing protein [Oscillospiraceae bacterium]|nr:phosphatidylinositol-specific phospholipase C domain-containing protein [Oscillospiraceae bacterium]
MEQTKKRSGLGRRMLRVLAGLLALLLGLAAFFTLAPLTERVDKSSVDGSADWMSRLNDSLLLSEINLPGTHDSATQYVQLAWFSKCQALSIREQLEAGVRYLDIRLGADGERLKLMHGFTNCKESFDGSTLDFLTVAAMCNYFVSEHPTETVILAVKQEHGEESVAQFQRMLDTVININPRDWLLTDTIPSLGEARGKMVLMRRYEDEAGLGERAGIPLLWPSQKGYQDTSLNTTAVDNGSYTLWVQDRFEYNSEDKWAAFIAGLEQNGAEKGDIALHFLSTKGTAAYGHPYAFAKDLNQRFFKTELPEGERIGWIVLDFVSAELAAHIYETNF